MVSSTSPILSLGDTLERLHPDELRIAPSTAFLNQPTATRAALLGAPSNQQIIDATKAFYNTHRKLVDASTNDTKNGAEHHSQYVKTMNSYNWKSQQLNQSQTATVSEGLGLSGSGTDKGIWDDTLDNAKATDIFSTIGIGVSADVQFFVGGAGGLGAIFDIAKREGAKGYGYATGEVGLRITAELNVQVAIYNLLPSQLNKDIYGLKVSISPGISLSFQVFYTQPGLTVLGYAIGAGIGAGGGATVFGGHIWNFG